MKKGAPLRISGVDRLPRRLGPDATPEEIIKAINELAIETQLCRVSIRDVGTKLGELSEHIRDALMGSSASAPPPARLRDEDTKP